VPYGRTPNNDLLKVENFLFQKQNNNERVSQVNMVLLLSRENRSALGNGDTRHSRLLDVYAC
jgi:hypothetical protein